MSSQWQVERNTGINLLVKKKKLTPQSRARIKKSFPERLRFGVQVKHVIAEAMQLGADSQGIMWGVPLPIIWYHTP